MDSDEPGGLTGPEALRAILGPTRVAIVGGSGDFSKISGRPVKFLRRYGFDGEAYVVNPSLPEIEGYSSVPNVAALPAAPDVAFVALPARPAISAVRELAEMKTPAAIVLASGFADAGGAGVALQRELASVAGSMRLLGPNTLGVINMTDHVMLTPSDALETPGLQAGSIGFASQSGGIMASLLSRAAARGIGYSKLLSTGNEVDLEICDCVEFLTNDPATSVIALYLETLRDPSRFVAVALKAAQAGKPIFCFKVGASEEGARAAASHTGALAGSEAVFDAVLERAGVTRLRRFSELLEVPAAVAVGKKMAGWRVGVLTTTGGAGTLIADLCGSAGLSLPLPGVDLAAHLTASFANAALDLAHNPIDLTLGGTRPEIMAPVIEALSSSADFDALIVIIGSSGVAQPRLVADPLVAAAARPGAKPLFAYASPDVPEVIARLNREGVPAFSSPEDCIAALAALAPPASRPATTAPLVFAPGGRLLDEDEGKALLSRFGIASPARVVAASPGELEALVPKLSGRLALKVLGRGLLHKSELGAVAVGLSTGQIPERAEEMLAAVHAARPELEIDGLLVEEMHEGIEVLLGFIRDRAFGAAVVVAAGGVATEAIDDRVVALHPVSERDARTLLARLRLFPLLSGGRSRHKPDLEALVAAIVSFSEMAEQLGDELIDAEVNPLVVLDEGEGVLALDVVVRLREQSTGAQPLALRGESS